MVEASSFDDVDRAVEKILEAQLDTVKALDGMERDVTAWEADFLQSVLLRLTEKKTPLTQDQLEIVRRMCEQYDIECDL